MAQTYNFDGTKLVIPGSYIKTKVLNENTGVAATGIIALVGEADTGPDYSLLKTAKNIAGISGNILVDDAGNRVAFTPDELSLVQGTFGAGRLVDAFAALAAPFAGTNIIGGTPSLVYVIKTNKTNAAKATVELQDVTGATKIADITALNYGELGNQITVKKTNAGSANSYGLIPLTLTVELKGATSSAKIFDKAALKLTAANQKDFVVSATTIVIGAGGSQKTYTLKDYLTVAALAAAINKETGTHGVTVTTIAEFQWVKPVDLFDRGTYSADTAPVWVSVCGWELKNIVSPLVSFTPTYTKPDTFAEDTLKLAGGVMGATSDEDISKALELLKKVSVNFVVPLFSQDAVDDHDADETSEDSTYTLENIVKNSLQHAIDCSAVKFKKNRQVFLSSNLSYANTKNLISNNGAYSSSAPFLTTPYQYRASVAFQGVRGYDVNTTAKDFQPWMVAVLSAAAQSVAGYRPIFNKGLNVLGINNPVDYTGTIPEQEGALQSGLLVLAEAANAVDTILLSDQTSYLFPDNNFVYNSVQAVYGADVIAMTIQQQMQIFVGQSNADVNSAVALAYLQSIMGTLLVNKWIASSIDAPNGYKNAKVSINGPVMSVAIEAKESTGIYFIPINLSISAVKN